MPSTPFDEFQEEISSINSIYGDGTLSPESSLDSGESNTFLVCILSPPALTIDPQIVLKLLFPISYPSKCPTVLDATTNGKGVSSDRALDIAKNVLEEVWIEGNVVVFDLVETLKVYLGTQALTKTRFLTTWKKFP